MVGEAVSWIYGLSFYVIAFCAVVSALVVISARNPVVSAVWLVVCFISVAGIYALLKAQFLAMVQVLVYAGAIMVLFVMIMMLMDIRQLERGGKGQKVLRFFAGAAGAVVMLILAVLASGTGSGRQGEAPLGTSEKIGEILFTKYLLPFEVLSLLLLGAVVSAIYLARRFKSEAPK